MNKVMFSVIIGLSLVLVFFLACNLGIIDLSVLGKYINSIASLLAGVPGNNHSDGNNNAFWLKQRILVN